MWLNNSYSAIIWVKTFLILLNREVIPLRPFSLCLCLCLSYTHTRTLHLPPPLSPSFIASFHHRSSTLTHSRATFCCISSTSPTFRFSISVHSPPTHSWSCIVLVPMNWCWIAKSPDWCHLGLDASVRMVNGASESSSSVPDSFPGDRNSLSEC